MGNKTVPWELIFYFEYLYFYVLRQECIVWLNYLNRINKHMWMSQIVMVTNSALRQDAHYFAKEIWKCVILTAIVRISLGVPWMLCVQVTLLPHWLGKWLGKEYMTSFYLNWSTLIARLIGPTWGPSGTDRTQVGPMLGTWTMLSGNGWHAWW